LPARAISYPAVFGSRFKSRRPSPPIVQPVGRSLYPLSTPPSLGVVRAGKQTST